MTEEEIRLLALQRREAEQHAAEARAETQAAVPLFPPLDMQEDMKRQAKAERERRELETSAIADRAARISRAEGKSREAERMIEAGRVRVNGEQITSPALNVTPEDKITVDNTPVGAPEPPRIPYC